jgi:anion-transporting  ArsA/GET3 family ATPase
LTRRPTRNALDFLDAPERLHRFIDSRSLRFFLSPGVKLLGRGSGLLVSALQRVTGIDLLRDLSDFFQSFGDMSEGFRARAKRVTELLGSDAATFVLVASPRRDASTTRSTSTTSCSRVGCRSEAWS